MTRAIRLWPLLTGTHRYEKVVSTRNRGHGHYIEAPILAYLIETPNGRVLYDVGCDYRKVATPELRARYFDPMRPRFDPPQMTQDQRIPSYLERLGLTPKDIDVVFLGHLHFDHAGGLSDLPGCEVHVHDAELAAAATGLYKGVFADELAGNAAWRPQSGDYDVAAGVHAVCTPGHTAGHMSLVIELPKGRPVVSCGDAADLLENLTEEIAPGYCWEDNEPLALESIRNCARSSAKRTPSCGPITTSISSVLLRNSRRGASKPETTQRSRTQPSSISGLRIYIHWRGTS